MSDETPHASITPEALPASPIVRRPISISQKISLCLITLLLCSISIALNFPYKLSVLDGKFYGLENNFFDLGHAEVSPTFTAAGWPFEYYLHVEYTDAPALSLFSFTRFILNALCCVLAITIVAFYRWHKSTLASTIKSDTIRLSVSDMLVLTAFCGGGLIYWQLMNQKSLQSHELAGKIYEQQGMAHVAPILPSFLKDKVPDFFLKMHERIVAIELNSPENDFLSQAVAQPYLQKFSATGTSFDADRLFPLATNPRLWSLRISGRQLAKPDELQFIGTMSQLRSLNLMRTSITSAALNQWTGVHRIQFMNLVHTDLVLSELSNPPWANQIETLHLPRPPRGISDSFEIDGWARLKELSINEFEELLNDTTFSLKINNLPVLQEVDLDCFQQFDIEITNTPSLNSIETAGSLFDDSQLWLSRLSKSQSGPTNVWIRRLRIEDAPELKKIKAYAADLEDCNLKGLNPQLAVIVTSRVFSRNQYQQYDHGQISLTKRTRLLNEFTESDELHHLVLSDFDTSRINFEKLRSCTRLEMLTLEECGIEKAQLLQLAGSESLKTLRVGNTVIDGATLSFVLKRLPHLELLQLPTGKSIDSLRLEGHPLKAIASESGIFDLRALRLIDLPNFESVLGLKHPVKHLHISNIPRMKGLVVYGSLPTDCLLELSESTEIFGVGGENVTDDRIQPFAKMGKLRKLSLVDTKLSNERMKEIGQLVGLNSVILAGDNVTDDVVSQLSRMKDLVRLEVVTNQSISGKALESFGSLSNLKFLTLRMSDADVVDYSWIGKLDRLEMIRLDGWRCTPELIQALSQLKNLACVGLEGTELTKTDLESLATKMGESFIRLGLQRSKVEGTGLRFLVDQRPSLTLELRDANVDNAVLAHAMKTNRLYTTYIDESFESERNASPRGMNTVSYGRQTRRVDAEWDVLDEEILDPVLFRMIVTNSSSTNQRARSPRSTIKTDSESGATDNKSSPTGKSEFLDLLDQLGK
ncbi:MAG: hypothetical protein ACK5YR_18185 [Pirellula sp.]|jgi:hypothetical protein